MERRYEDFTKHPAAYLAARRDEVNEIAYEQTISDTKHDYEKRGITKGLHQTALRMLVSGKYTLEEIAEVTNLDREEVERLSKLKYEA